MLTLLQRAARTIRTTYLTPRNEARVDLVAEGAIVARAIIDKNGNVILSGDAFAALIASTTSLSGALLVNDPTTPSVTTAASKTNTGFFKVFGKTSGALILKTADATAQTITLLGAAQTVGASTWNIPDAAGATQTFVTLALTQTLTSKTLTAPVIGGGLTASGSAANTFAGSTGPFLTSTGLNTLGGTVALKTIATPVAAAGTTGADAGALGEANVQTISSDSAAKGVKLTTGVAGQVKNILNTSGTAAILYPATGGTINGLAANAGVLIPASKGTKAICTAADTWTTYDLAAKSTAA